MEKRIEYIRVIAQYGSIAKAAEKLYITSSALSKYLTNVEKSLNTVLFDRTGKHLILTYAGERYLYWAERIRQLQDDMETEFQDISASNTGRIKIGIMLDDFQIFSRIILPHFFSIHPNVKVEVTEEPNRILRRKLEDNELDLAVLNDYKVSDVFVKHILAPIYPVLVASQNSPLVQIAKKSIAYPYPWVPVEALKDARFVAPFEDQDGYGAFERLSKECGFVPQIILQAKNVHLQATLIENYNALLCGYDCQIKRNFQMSKLSLLSYGEPRTPQYLVIAYRKDHYIDNACRTMIELCKEYLSTEMFKLAQP